MLLNNYLFILYYKILNSLMSNKDDSKFNLIILSKPDAKFFYLIVFILASLLRRLIPMIIKNARKDESDLHKIKDYNYNINRCYFDLLSNYIGDILAGIMTLINNLISKFKTTTTEAKEREKDMRKKSLFYLSIIAVIDIIAQLCLFLFSKVILPNKLLEEEAIKNENLYFVVSIDIFSRYIFSRIFLQSYFYKHHIVSIVLTFIGFIPLIIKNLLDITTFNNNNNIIKNWEALMYLILFIYMTIIYSLEDVFNKLCFNQSILEPYDLMFYKALIQTIFVIPLTIYVCVGNNLFDYIINNIDFYRVCYRFSFIIFNIFRTWSLLNIIRLVDPNLLSVLKSSEFAVLFIFLSIYNVTVNNDNKMDKTYYICGGICCVFSLLGSFIHNELIIINKFGLLKCTKYYKFELDDNQKFPSIEDLDTDDNDSKNNQTDHSLLDTSNDY